MKVLLEAFLYLQLGFATFWRKNFGTEAACKILVKLTTYLSLTVAISLLSSFGLLIYNFWR